ncbi:MAG: putative amidohydrolase, partial [Geminicoccaceae bacterium]|nr:putative amidohydrolase [Geminicoccaceae bacterium]
MNTIREALNADQGQMKAWFEHMHRHPELSMQERETAEYIANLVRHLGYDVATGVGKHGIVASMTVGDSGKAIGLRADFDALPIQEDNDLDYRSEVAGVAHLCGHDGHTTMLLAAGKYLAETKNFDGTVRLIFQPGEETMEGGPAMIRDGLFTRFPVDAVFGMHNMPGLDLGTLYFAHGDVMAAVDNWEIELM